MAMPGTTISQLRDTPPPAGLVDSILRRLALLERRRALLRAGALGVVCLLSCLGSVQAFFYTLDEMYLSGFSEFFRLLLNSGASVSLRDTALALVDTLPALPLALVCATVFLFVWSLARAARNLREAAHLSYAQHQS
jgi:hypothetical protein